MEVVIGLVADAVFLVALIGSLIMWARVRERKMTADAFTVRKPMPIAYAATGIIAFFGFLLFAFLIGPDLDMGDPVLYVIIAFLLTGIFMLADTVYWKISVDKNRIAYRTLFGKRGTAEFGNIARVKSYGMKLSVYTGDGKMFTAAVTYTGYRTLIERLKQEKITIETQGSFL